MAKEKPLSLVDDKDLDGQIEVLASCCIELDRITTQSSRRITLEYLWDRYVDHPVKLPDRPGAGGEAAK